MNRKPPRLATRLLRSFVHVHYQEEVEGDLEEVFQINASGKGLFLAQFLYWIHVLKAMKIYPVRRSPSDVLHEIKHFVFLKLALRNIWKRRGAHLINAIGLTAALVSFIVILNFTSYEQGFDKFHEHGDRIARVGFDWGELNEDGENKSIYASNVPAMGKLLEAEIPEIESQTTFVPVLTIRSSCYIRNRDSGLTIRGDNGLYADDRFLSVFSFPAEFGDVRALSETNSLVVTSSFARKLFGTASSEDVVGRSVSILTDKEENYTITAVLADVPANSHIKFDYLISYATINSRGLQENIYWSQFYCYVLLTKWTHTASIASKLPEVARKVYGTDTRISLFLQPLEVIHLNSNLREELGTPGSRSTVSLLTIVAYVVLLVGWVNFTNLFLALAVERIKEVGIKKVLGSTRVHLILQFLSESVLVNVLSCVLSVLCFLAVSPYVASWIGITFVNTGINNALVAAVLVFLVCGSLITGVLPAWLLSSYSPLKAMEKKIQELPLFPTMKQALLYFQFTVCFAVIASAWIMKKQLLFMQNADIGISLGQTIAIKLPPNVDAETPQLIESFQQKMRQYPIVDHATTSSGIPGSRIVFSGGVQRTDGQKLEGNNVLNIYTNENFVNTFQLRMLAGKNFDASIRDTIPHVLLNEAAVRVSGFKSNEDAVGNTILWQKNRVYIDGVFRNYNHLFLKEAFEPMMLTHSKTHQQFISVKFRAGTNPLTNNEVLSLLKDTWSQGMPGNPFDYVFLEDNYGKQYEAIQQEQKLIQSFATLSLVICGIGLFSISAYVIRNRLKEIAIRKVLGAGSESLVTLLLRDKIRLILVSSLLGSAVTYFATSSWLENFAFSIRLSYLDFTWPLLIILGAMLMSIGYHVFRAVKVEPVNLLKDE